MRVSSKTAFAGGEGDRFEEHLGGKIGKALYDLELVEGNEQSKIKARIPDMIYKKYSLLSFKDLSFWAEHNCSPQWMI